MASKAERLSPGKGDRSADGVEGNFDQKYLRDTLSMSRNDSKEKVKKSVLSIKMLRATATSFYGGHGGTIAAVKSPSGCREFRPCYLATAERPSGNAPATRRLFFGAPATASKASEKELTQNRS